MAQASAFEHLSVIGERVRPDHVLRTLARTAWSRITDFEVSMTASSLKRDEYTRHTGLVALNDVEPTFAREVEDRLASRR